MGNLDSAGRSDRNGAAGSSGGTVNIVGGGIAGLSAAIECASAGASVMLYEAHEQLGGRGRSADGDYKANLGPHALYDGPFHRWLVEQRALPATVAPKLTGSRVRLGGELRRMPPLRGLPGLLRLRGRQAPVEQDFRSWAAEFVDPEMVDAVCSAGGLFTFYHDPGSLSAAFVWPRLVRSFFNVPTPVRYPVGGWSSLIQSLQERAQALGVRVSAGTPLQSLPEPPVIVATELADARRLLGEEDLSWLSGRTLCLDLGLQSRRGDPSIVLDLDQAGWVGRYSTTNPSIVPEGEQLIQAQMPIRPDESAEQATLRLEALLDVSLEQWRERQTWRRRQVMDGRSGALDLPGQSWEQRPALDRGNGRFLAGDMVAAPGLLAEVSWASAIQAGALALQWFGQSGAAVAQLERAAAAGR